MLRIIHTLTLASVVLSLVLSLGCSSEAKLQKHLDRADAFFQQGRYEEAEIEYRNARKIEPSHPRAVGQLGLIYFHQGRNSAALPLLSHARENNPGNLEVCLKLAFFQLVNGEKQKAREEALAILKADPTTGEAQILLAQCAETREEAESIKRELERLLQDKGRSVSLHLAMATIESRFGEPDLAEKEINNALSMDPNSSEAHHALGNLHWKQGKPEQAERSLRKAYQLSPTHSHRRIRYADIKIARGDIPGAKTVLQEMIGTARDYLPAYQRLAELALSEKDFATCESLIETLLKKDPSSFDALFLQGRMCIAQNQSRKAERIFERLSAVYPKSWQVQHYAGLLHLGNNDLLQAETSFRNALSLAPSNPDPTIQLARTELRKGEPASAAELLEELLQANSPNAEAQFLLASAWKEQGRMDDAIRIYERLEATIPSDPQIPFSRGLTWLEQGSVAKARAAFEKSLSISKTYFPALEQIVDLEIRQNKYDEAFARITEFNQEKNSSELHYLAAKIFLAKAAFREAEKNLEMSLSLDPEFAPARLHRARLHFELGRYKPALADLNVILAKDLHAPAALLLKASIETRQVDLNAARKTLEILVKVDPHSVSALNNLAYLYAEDPDRLELAYGLARKASEMAPGNPHVAHTLGWIQCKRGNYADALPKLRESSQLFPEKQEMRFHLGYVLYMLGDEEAARVELERTVRHQNGNSSMQTEAAKLLEILDLKPSPAHVAVLESRLTVCPHDPIAHTRLAATMEGMGRSAEATRHWEAALKHNTPSSFILTNLCRLYAAQGEKEKILTLYRSAHEDLKARHDVTRYFSKAAYELGEHRWALSLLDAPGGPAPDASQLLESAICHYSVGQLEEAESKVKTALQLETTLAGRDRAVLFLEACGLAREPNLNETKVARIKQILEIDSKLLPGMVARARAVEQSGQIQEARQLYLAILTQFPHFAPARKFLARLYARPPQDWSQCELWARQFYHLHPGDRETASLVGIALYHQGAFQRCIPFLKEGLEQNVPDPELFYFLGKAQLHSKEIEEGKRFLQQALSLDRDSPLAPGARQLLKQTP